MAPQIASGEYVLINTFAYRFSQPKRGDIVAFRNDEDARPLFIKRVVGLPGDRIAVDRGRVFVNGTGSTSPTSAIPTIARFPRRSSRRTRFTSSATTALNSEDSRFFGPVRRRPADRPCAARDLAAGRSGHLVAYDRAARDASIQWYPGHMARAMRKIGEYVKLVDIVIEVVDARVPHSGRNPALDALVAKAPRIVALAREDLADPQTTKAWIAALAGRGLAAIAVDARSQTQRGSRRGRRNRIGETRAAVSSRAIVVGIPNSGKSSIINGLSATFRR